MSHLNRLAGAAVLALSILGVPAVAQERGGDAQAPAAQPQRPDPQQPRADEGQRDPQQQPADRPNAERGAQPGQAPRGTGSASELHVKKMAEEETKHRETLAKLERLRALAQEKGQTERLAALADLLKKENDRFKAMRDMARQKLGEDGFRALEERLANGRVRGPQAGRKPPQGKEPGRKPDAKPDRPQGQQPQGERPKADPPKRDNQQGGAQQGGQRNDSPRG